MQRSSSGPTERDRANGSSDRNERSHLALIERVVLAAFPKDPEARKRVSAFSTPRATAWRITAVGGLDLSEPK